MNILCQASVSRLVPSCESVNLLLILDRQIQRMISASFDLVADSLDVIFHHAQGTADTTL
jgi:hypothetical protein